jgi:hypothetical protein
LKMTGLLRRTFFFNEQQSKYAFLFDQWEPQITGEVWDFFRACGFEWPTVVHSSDI